MSRPGILRAALRDEWDGLERITRDLRPADFFTLLNAFAGLAAILFAIQGRASWAATTILLAIILDGVDGAVARLGGGGGPLGGTLDTLADTVTFVAAPPLVVFMALGDPVGAGQWVLVTVPMGFYALAGLLRLARFESMREQRPRGYFSGLSSPGAALLIMAFLMVDLSRAWVLGVVVLGGLLMMSRIRYPKLRGALGITAVAVILAVLVTTGLPEMQQRATWAMLAFMAIYVTAGPFYVLARVGPTPPPKEAS